MMKQLSGMTPAAGWACAEPASVPEPDRRTTGNSRPRARQATPRQEHSTTMAVKIRLMRMGAKKAPFYRVLVADSRNPATGASSRISGSTTPTTSRPRSRSTPKACLAGQGAQPAEAVAKLLAIAGVEGMAERQQAVRKLRATVASQAEPKAKAKPRIKAKK